MNDTAIYIHKAIYDAATKSNGKIQWIKYRHTVRKRLEQLEPDVPDDNSINCIAFNVGNGKPVSYTHLTLPTTPYV